MSKYTVKTTSCNYESEYTNKKEFTSKTEALKYAKKQNPEKSIYVKTSIYKHISKYGGFLIIAWIDEHQILVKTESF